MIHLHELPDSAVQYAIENGDFPEDILAEEHVAVIMTQSWCIEWLQMRSWLKRLADKGKPEKLEIQVYTVVYDKADYFHEFMAHKEEVFGNQLVPYVRYYSRGALRSESNYLPRGAFLGRFEE